VVEKKETDHFLKATDKGNRYRDMNESLPTGFLDRYFQAPDGVVTAVRKEFTGRAQGSIALKRLCALS